MEESQSVGSLTRAHPQPYDVGKCLNPTTLFYNCSEEDFWITDDQRAGIVCRRVGGVRESLFPGLEVNGGTEGDFGEKVFSDARNPRFRDATTALESPWFAAQEVDDVVGDF